ncbi:PstS family phosphate ABC transporter substrate-binding protein [Vibrio galatheae]|nr:substrate-binding domain-containing protein [Vibrio galatheae]
MMKFISMVCCALPLGFVASLHAEEPVSAIAVDSHMVELVNALTDGKFPRLDILSREDVQAAMLNREVRVGISARRWTDLEVAQFEKQTGYRPTELYFTAGVVAIIANNDNPNHAISLDKLRSVFGCHQDLLPARWSQWGESNETPLMLPFAIDEGLKLHHKFHQWVTCREGTYASTQFVVDGAALEEALDDSEAALGYVTYSKRWEGFKTLSIIDDRGEIFDVNKETILSGRYPLSSVYYLYIDLPPHRNYLTDSEKKIVGMVLNDDNREIFNEYGFISLPSQAILRNYVKLGLQEPRVEHGYK